MPNRQLKNKALEQVENNRMQVLVNTSITPSLLCVADDSQLLLLQKQLLLGDTWGMLEVTKDLMPANMQIDSLRTYRLALAVPKDTACESVHGRRVWRELLRLAIAMRLWPGKRGKIPKFSTIISVVRVLGQITKRIAATDEENLWLHISRAQVNKWLGHSRIVHYNCLAHYHSLGALPYGPASAKRSGLQQRRDRTSEPEHSTEAKTSKQWQPFPDAYTAAAGWRALKFTCLVGPTLLDALEKAADTQVRTSNSDGMPFSNDYIWHLKRKNLDPIIAEWDWRSPDGLPLDKLPMTVNLRTKGGAGKRFSWPPSTHSEAVRLLYLLQACHLWLIALSLAGRHGEILSMHENCLSRETTNTPTGTFTSWKLDGISGREAEAPLPDMVVIALRQQQRLSRLVKDYYKVDGDHLWVKLAESKASEGGQRLNSFANALSAFNSAFELKPVMGGTVLHMHRFRKTLARIVALALVHAPKILMDIFGHKDEQMTVMRYILSDPGILSEIEELMRELVILKGLEAVTKSDQLQGKAAPLLRDRVAQYSKLLGRDALEPQNLREFVHTITEGGGGWAIIGPGKVCTGFTLGGACNQGAGQANPHYCSPECHNQLLIPDFEQVDGSIASAIIDAINTVDYMVEQLTQADDNGENMLIAQFGGQIKSLLHQWREVDLHFMKNYIDHPVVLKHIPNVVLIT